MEKKENYHYQQFIESFEYSAEIKLTHSQKFSLALELQRFTNQILSEYWSNLHDAHRQTEKTFNRRTI